MASESVQVSKEAQVTKIVFGWDNVSVLTETGDVLVQGDNLCGTFGLGENASGRCETFRRVTGVVSQLHLASVQDLSSGECHALLLLKDGSVLGAGSNAMGQLGLRDTITTRVIGMYGNAQLVNDDPVDFLTWTQIPALAKHPIKLVAAGENHSVLVDKNNAVWTAGDDDCNQLGRNKKRGEHQFVRVLEKFASPILSVVTGDRTTFLVTEAGQVFGCGDNESGQLGFLDWDQEDEAMTNDGRANRFAQVDLPEDEHATKVAAGTAHTLILTRSGRVYASGWSLAWGVEEKGKEQSGAASLDWFAFKRLDLPPQHDDAAEMVPVIDIACGQSATAILKADGTLWWAQVSDKSKGIPSGWLKLDLPDAVRPQHIALPTTWGPPVVIDEQGNLFSKSELYSTFQKDGFRSSTGSRQLDKYVQIKLELSTPVEMNDDSSPQDDEQDDE